MGHPCYTQYMNVPTNKDIGEYTVLFEPVSYQIESDFGSFEVQESDDGVIRMEFTDREGEIIDLADLLPSSYKFVGESVDYYKYLGDLGDRSAMLSEDQVIYVSSIDLNKYGWQYLLTLFHEIGHAIQFDNDPSLIDKLGKLKRSFSL